MALFFRQLKRYFRQPTVPSSTKTVVKSSKQGVVVKTKSIRGKLYPIPAYVLVVDESSSTSCPMRMASARTTTRIKAIQLAGQGYLQHLRSSSYKQLVGVVGFSDNATLYHPLAPVGRAMASLSRSLHRLHPRGITNLSDGLDLALDLLRKARTTRGNIVVITDGAANVGTHRLPELTSQARDFHIRIFTIGVGNNGDSDYDQGLLKKLARCTGGRFMSAHSFKALCNALRKAC